MKKKIITASVLFILSIAKMYSQTASLTGTVAPAKHLSTKVKFCDTDRNDTLSVQEVRTVFDTYLTNSNRNEPSDLITDVENVLIDLIAYLEKVNCEALKNRKDNKVFIEQYFTDRFASAK